LFKVGRTIQGHKMNQGAPQEARSPLELLRRFQLTLDDVHSHAIIAPQVRDSHVAIEAPASEYLRRSRFSRIFSFLYALNVEKFEKTVHDLLKSCVMGYALELRSGGDILLSKQYNYSKNYNDGLLGWDADTPLHVASVSKLITAMAMTQLLRDHRIALDDKIAPWLPQYWPRGINVQNLAFRHLLTHTSGLLTPVKAPGPMDFQSMKDAIALGTTDLTTRDYKNVNYSLCRVLLATINGDAYPSMFITADSMFAPLFAVRDSVWDTLSIRSYLQYVNDNIFTPSGLPARDFNRPDEAALAYLAIYDNSPGWNSGDKQSGSGAIGWHLTVRELLRVMATYRRRGKIVGAWRAQKMLDDGIGVDFGFTRDTRLGRLYAKGGFWGSKEGRIEQTNAFFLPGRMELVVLANSPGCMPDTAFMGKVSDAVDRSIEPWIVSLTSTLLGKLGAGA